MCPEYSIGVEHIDLDDDLTVVAESSRKAGEVRESIILADQAHSVVGIFAASILEPSRVSSPPFLKSVFDIGISHTSPLVSPHDPSRFSHTSLDPLKG